MLAVAVIAEPRKEVKNRAPKTIESVLGDRTPIQLLNFSFCEKTSIGRRTASLTRQQDVELVLPCIPTISLEAENRV